MKIFDHTSREPNLWRGWFADGQSVELSKSKSGWDFGVSVCIHESDGPKDGKRLLHLEFWRWSLFLPLGHCEYPWLAKDAPQWSILASSEFGFVLHWNFWRKSWAWPWDLHTLAYQEQLTDGTWRDVFTKFYDKEIVRDVVYEETHPYTYILRSGEVQDRTATVSKRRHVLCRKAFQWLGWPRWNRESIDVRFSDEVGERTGSWKGGTIGCSYNLKPGETMLESLRRMEAERKF